MDPPHNTPGKTTLSTRDVPAVTDRGAIFVVSYNNCEGIDTIIPTPVTVFHIPKARLSLSL